MDNTSTTTSPACEGHNWELQRVMPEWVGGTTGSANYREIALVGCTFCGIIRKTVIENL